MPLSSSDWVGKFPTSVDLDDLAAPFKDNAKAFIAAMLAAGASIKISATYRPRERAYLMYYAFRIAREGMDPTTVPPMSGVDIDWVHRDAKGKINIAASRNAAEDMVNGYDIVYRPALRSNHTRRLAVDMTISWDGTLAVKNKRGRVVQIAGTPKSGLNHDLIVVGASYGVLKLISDPPHWSSDGH